MTGDSKAPRIEDLEIHECHGDYFAIKDLKIAETHYDGAFIKFTISYLTAGNKELAEEYVSKMFRGLARQVTGKWTAKPK